MKLYKDKINSKSDLELAQDLSGSFDQNVIFHCFWNGALNEKHIISLKSCYFFNVYNKSKRVIYLWLENNKENSFNEEAKKYATIKTFDRIAEQAGTFLEDLDYYYKKDLSFYSDVVRYILLYKYGGCWFDLDVLFLRDFTPLFSNFTNDICVYQWEYQNYPNGAIFISLVPQSESLKEVMEYIIKERNGWGFQEAKLTYDSPLKFLVLPCAWFDPTWIKNNSPNVPEGDFLGFITTTKNNYSFDNFFKGAFTYHWHNSWNNPIEPHSIFDQLNQIIDNGLLQKGGKKGGKKGSKKRRYKTRKLRRRRKSSRK